MTTTIGSQSDVPATGDPIVTPWYQDTAKKIVHTFASTAARDAWVSPPVGAMCVTTDTDTLWQRTASGWANRGAASAGTVPRHFARAYRTAAYSAPQGYATVVFDTEAADPDNCYNPATGEYTIPVTGTYQINATATVGYNNNPQVFIIAVFLDGTPTLRGNQFTLRNLSTGDLSSLVVAGAVNAAAGAKFTIKIYNGASNPCAFDVGAAGNNMMSIHRVI